MPLVNWLAGNDITAANLNLMQNGQYVLKPSDQSVTSNHTVWVNDNALFLPMVANATYWFECFLSFEGGTLGSSDFQMQWVAPSGATARFGVSCFGIGGGWNGLSEFLSDTIVSSSNGTSNLRPVMISGSVTNGGTAGNLQLQWAQNSSSATATTVQAQSVLAMLRIS